MSTQTETKTMETLRTLPGDDVRQIMWRFADRYELQMLVQGARGVARGPVARLVAQGEREGGGGEREAGEQGRRYRRGLHHRLRQRRIARHGGQRRGRAGAGGDESARRHAGALPWIRR